MKAAATYLNALHLTYLYSKKDSFKQLLYQRGNHGAQVFSIYEPERDDFARYPSLQIRMFSNSDHFWLLDMDSLPTLYGNLREKKGSYFKLFLESAEKCIDAIVKEIELDPCSPKINLMSKDLTICWHHLSNNGRFQEMKRLYDVFLHLEENVNTRKNKESINKFIFNQKKVLLEKVKNFIESIDLLIFQMHEENQKALIFLMLECRELTIIPPLPLFLDNPLLEQLIQNNGKTLQTLDLRDAAKLL